MNTRLTALVLTAATILSLTPKPALAGNKEWAAIGGFIGGVIVGSAIHERHHDAYPPRPTTVIVNDRDYGRPAGYWKDVTVRTWLPGYWVEECDRYGRTYRRYIEGHYEFRTDRVWVAFDRQGGYESDDGYGYSCRR